MGLKVFYSWQMDMPRKTNKDFIRSALDEALKILAADIDLSDADRLEISIDQDTQGVLGSPDISKVIFEKISQSDIIVADVSIVTDANNARGHINSNVGIELGYALSAVSDRSLLKVMNTYGGGPDKLPFDLRNRRHPLQYLLPPDSSSTQITQERNSLASKLARVLKEYIAEPTIHRPAAAHEEFPSTENRGKFWLRAEALIPKIVDQRLRSDIMYSNDSIIYVRFIPILRTENLTPKEALDAVGDLEPLSASYGWTKARNKWGAIVYDFDRQSGELFGATQVLNNRELWAVDTYYSNRETTSDDEGELPKRFIPTGAISSEYPKKIKKMCEVAQRLGYGDEFLAEIGYCGAYGTYLAIAKTWWNRLPGPILSEQVYARIQTNAENAARDILNSFWTKAFAEIAHEVPSELMMKADD